jgi:hypothetical protein
LKTKLIYELKSEDVHALETRSILLE